MVIQQGMAHSGGILQARQVTHKAGLTINLRGIALLFVPLMFLLFFVLDKQICQPQLISRKHQDLTSIGPIAQFKAQMQGKAHLFVRLMFGRQLMLHVAGLLRTIASVQH